MEVVGGATEQEQKGQLVNHSGNDTAGDGGKLRLFVGGLPKDVRTEELRERFTPFGIVTDVYIVPEKRTQPISTISAFLIAGIDDHKVPNGYGPSKEATANLSSSSITGTAECRGFGYVELMPTSETSLRKCFSIYNGCKWRGGQMKVEKAKEHYKLRLEREWALLKTETDASTDNAGESGEKKELGDGTAATASSKSRSFAFNDVALHHKFFELRPLKIAWHHCSKKLKIVPAAGGPGTGKHRRSFPRIEPRPLEHILEEVAGTGGKRRKVEEVLERKNIGSAHEIKVSNKGMSQRRANPSKASGKGREERENAEVEAVGSKGLVTGVKRGRSEQDIEEDHTVNKAEEAERCKQAGRRTRDEQVVVESAVKESREEEKNADGDDDDAVSAKKFQEERKKQLAMLGSLYPNDKTLTREQTRKPASRKPALGFVAVARFDPSRVEEPTSQNSPGGNMGDDDESGSEDSNVNVTAEDEVVVSSSKQSGKTLVSRKKGGDSEGGMGKRGRPAGIDAAQAEGKRAKKVLEDGRVMSKRDEVDDGDEDEDDEDEDDDDDEEIDDDDNDDDEDDGDGLDLGGLSAWERALAMAAGTTAVLGSCTSDLTVKQVSVEEEHGHSRDTLHAHKESENELASRECDKGIKLKGKKHSGSGKQTGNDQNASVVKKTHNKGGSKITIAEAKEEKTCLEVARQQGDGLDNTMLAGSEGEDVPGIQTLDGAMEGSLKKHCVSKGLVSRSEKGDERKENQLGDCSAFSDDGVSTRTKSVNGKDARRRRGKADVNNGGSVSGARGADDEAVRSLKNSRASVEGRETGETVGPGEATEGELPLSETGSVKAKKRRNGGSRSSLQENIADSLKEDRNDTEGDLEAPANSKGGNSAQARVDVEEERGKGRGAKKKRGEKVKRQVFCHDEEADPKSRENDDVDVHMDDAKQGGMQSNKQKTKVQEREDVGPEEMEDGNAGKERKGKREKRRKHLNSGENDDEANVHKDKAESGGMELNKEETVVEEREMDVGPEEREGEKAGKERMAKREKRKKRLSSGENDDAADVHKDKAELGGMQSNREEAVVEEMEMGVAPEENEDENTGKERKAKREKRKKDKSSTMRPEAATPARVVVTSSWKSLVGLDGSATFSLGSVTNTRRGVTVTSSWKSLVDSEGRATFSLGSILGTGGSTKQSELMKVNANASVAVAAVMSGGKEVAENGKAEQEEWRTSNERRYGGQWRPSNERGYGGEWRPSNESGYGGHDRNNNYERMNQVENEGQAAVAGEQKGVGDGMEVVDKSEGAGDGTGFSFMRSPNAEEEWLVIKRMMESDFLKKRKAAIKAGKIGRKRRGSFPSFH